METACNEETFELLKKSVAALKECLDRITGIPTAEVQRKELIEIEKIFLSLGDVTKELVYYSEYETISESTLETWTSMSRNCKKRFLYKANDIHRISTLGKCYEFMEKLMESLLERNIAKAEVGSAGGDLELDDCIVQIPEGGNTEAKEYHIETTLDTGSLPTNYTPISAILECRPSANFNKPVTISIPCWCIPCADVEAKVVCKSSASRNWEVLKTITANEIGKSITFETMHFSLFSLVVHGILPGTNYFVEAQLLFTSPLDFVFVLSVKHRSIRKKWQKKLKAVGYQPTKCITNSMSVKNGDKIQLSLICTNQTNLNEAINKNREFEVDINPFKSKHTYTEQFSFTPPFKHLYLSFELEIKQNDKRGKVIPFLQKISEADREEERTPRPAPKEERIDNVFLGIIRKEFTNDTFRTFAMATEGLSLDYMTLANIWDVPNRDINIKKFETLMKWKEKHKKPDKELIKDIRERVENFRKTL